MPLPPSHGLGPCCVAQSDEDVLRSKIRVDIVAANREQQQFMQELLSLLEKRSQKQLEHHLQAVTEIMKEMKMDLSEVRENSKTKLPLPQTQAGEPQTRVFPTASADPVMEKKDTQARGTMSMMPRMDFDDSQHLQRLEKASDKSIFKSFAKRKSLRGKELDIKPNIFLTIVSHQLFQTASATAIFLSIIAMGVEADQDVRTAIMDPPQELSYLFTYANTAFFIMFLAEVVLKVLAYKVLFFTGDEKAWNLFDGFLVATQAVEIAAQGFPLGGMRAMRILRLVRTLRVIRLLHIFRDLRMMVVCIFNSFMSLLWALTLLGAVTYVFAILCVQGTASYMRYPFARDIAFSDIVPGGEEIAGAFQTDMFSEDGLRQQAMLHFPTLLRTMLSLLMGVTGGVDWYQIFKPLMNIGPFYSAAFIFYVLLIVFCIMNVLSAVFVEMALQIKDRDLLIQAELSKIDGFLQDMRDLFEEVDCDGDGTVTRVELSQYMTCERVMAYFGGQGLDMSDVGLMFDLLDSSGDGCIGMPEFLLGTLRLKGGARCIEVMRIFQALDHIRMELGTVQTQLGLEPALFQPSADGMKSDPDLTRLRS